MRLATIRAALEAAVRLVEQADAAAACTQEVDAIADLADVQQLCRRVERLVEAKKAELEVTLSARAQLLAVRGVCATCGATRQEVDEHGHRLLRRRRWVRVQDLPQLAGEVRDFAGTSRCPEACCCIPECFSRTEHDRWDAETVGAGG